MDLNLIVYILSHVLGTTYWYFVLSFRISTVFDINPIELVRFQNSRYFVSLCSFSCPTLPFSFSFSYFKYKSRKQFRSFSTVFILTWLCSPWADDTIHGAAVWPYLSSGPRPGTSHRMVAVA